MQPFPFDKAIEDYMSAPDNQKPRWADLAKRYGAETPEDVGKIGDCIRGQVRRKLAHKGQMPITTRSERLRVTHPFLAQQCDEQGLPIDRTDRYWTKTDNVSVLTVVEKEEGPTLTDRLREHLEEIKTYAPIYPVLLRQQYDDPHLFVVDPADPHFGKLALPDETGDTYNLDIAASRFSEGIEGLIRKASGYSIEKIVFVGGNDFLHTDTVHGTTTAGTSQDTDSQWWNHYAVAKRSLIAALERLLTIADVHFVHCPSNHDFQSGFFLADSIASWFSRNPNITFDNRPIHRKYFQYGQSLIGATHGNGAPESALSDLMKSEAKIAWSRSKYAYFYVHHIHHKDTSAYRGKKKVILEKDYSDVTVLSTGKALIAEDYCHVEYLRSQSGTDNYHFTHGYTHQKKAIEGFLHSKEFGQVARLSHLF